MSKLTDKQIRFCQQYVIDLNATQSAIRAGYSEKTAYSIGQENLKKPEIQEYISELQKDIAEKTKWDHVKVLNMLGDIAENGEKDSDRLKALENIGKHIGFFEVDNNQKRSITTVNLKDAIKFTNGDNSK